MTSGCPPDTHPKGDSRQAGYLTRQCATMLCFRNASDSSEVSLADADTDARHCSLRVSRSGHLRQLCSDDVWTSRSGLRRERGHDGQSGADRLGQKRMLKGGPCVTGSFSSTPALSCLRTREKGEQALEDSDSWNHAVALRVSASLVH